jgi:hypothetical protein
LIAHVIKHLGRLAKAVRGGDRAKITAERDHVNKGLDTLLGPEPLTEEQKAERAAP